MTRGGKREGAGGKKPCLPQDELRKNRTIKLSDAEYDKFKLKGGAKWLRKKLEEI